MNKYLEDIFIHLDGIVMAPIYEQITDSEKTGFSCALQPYLTSQMIKVILSPWYSLRKF